jgi:choline kinase
MKFVLLAAGRGSRLSPLTDFYPKCLTPFLGKPILDYMIDNLKKVGISQLILVSGYKSEILEDHIKRQGISYKIYLNKDFANTNMVFSLFKAREEFDDDLIISYSDIIFTPQILRKIIQSKAAFGTIVDTDWRTLWKIRMDNPLDDVETLKLDRSDSINEIGGKPNNLEEIEGQYIGLSKLSKSFLPAFSRAFDQLSHEKATKIHFTDFMQHLIKKNVNIRAIKVNGGWVEIDSIRDLENYESSLLMLRRLGLKV